MFNRRKNFGKKINIWRLTPKKVIYSKKRLANPFFHHQKNKLNKTPRSSWKIKLIFLTIFLLIIALSWLFFFSLIFKIKLITVSGAQRTPAKEIENIAWRQTNETLGLQKNIFLFSKNSLMATLNNDYYFDNLIVKKNFPSVISISFKEKLQSAIWHEAEKYYYLDNSGNIISQVDPLNIKQKNIPLIDNLGAALVNAGEKNINIEKVKLKYTIDLFDKLKGKRDILQIDKLIIDQEEYTVMVAILGGPIIKFNAREDIDKQINNLLIFIDKKLKDDFLKMKNIDIRFGDLIYYN